MCDVYDVSHVYDMYDEYDEYHVYVHVYVYICKCVCVRVRVRECLSVCTFLYLFFRCSERQVDEWRPRKGQK